MKRFYLFIYLLLIVFIYSSSLYAADLTSNSFIIRDPIMGGGNYQSSSSFKLFNTGNFTIQGLSSSTSFEGRFGFQYYPFISVGTLTKTVTGSSVELDWDVFAAGLGYDVAGYKVGISNMSGSGYTYTSVGNVVTYTYNNLVPGTYYFVVQTIDGSNDVLGVSNEVDATIQQVLSFSLSENSIGFGPLGTGTVRYATDNGSGTTSLTPAHQLAIETNASSGYTITYNGPAFGTTSHSISGATITADIDGAPGQEQFAISADTDGDATITSGYTVDNYNWKYTPNTNETLITESLPTTEETISLYYLANIGLLTPSGSYSSVITYTSTANF